MPLIENGGVLLANKTIKYDPARSILKLAIGAPIVLTAETFARLADAFFAEIEARFP